MQSPNSTLSGEINLSPFDFWPSRASRIQGLGGSEPSDDPAYVFHTRYVPMDSSTVRCALIFTGLTATMGSVVFRVNALPVDGSRPAETIKTWSIAVKEIVAGGGTTRVSFDAVDGMQYALLGHLYTETDAAAEAFTLQLDATVRQPHFEQQVEAARKSIFGQRVFRRASRLLAPGKATLADPVSQTCTASQFNEPAYDQWLERLKLAKHRHRKQWEFVYILQALERYGMLKAGARGLGFGVGVEPLPAAMAAMGCSVVATDLAGDDERSRDWSLTNQHSDGLDQLRYPDICANDVFDRNVAFRVADMNLIPSDLRGFDFTWSSCAYEHLGSIEAGLDFVRNAVQCLNPGGLAVHTTELNLTSNDATIDSGGTVLFRRRDFERLAVDLVSRGHFVAQIKYDLGDTQQDAYVDVPPYSDDNHLKLALGQYVTTSFGIIIRRGDT
ncbi:hypothetical protein ASF00_02170 [Sphingomonas sp. Leaf34]|uniref:class I SAM-dependent methyltransferase n=1 Tax=Sphingomonas sp. Leaf34 TaxID=1736216 RepID=UPI0006FBBFED|nr:class I SAM-dependent methyltransferase [Sphingomonas sp. Leaf34]KQN31623.1 hypothetical protein ASF00_02170 [Sphingomonas sp. Leaf34]